MLRQQRAAAVAGLRSMSPVQSRSISPQPAPAAQPSSPAAVSSAIAQPSIVLAPSPDERMVTP